MKKLLLLMMSLILVFGLLPVSVNAAGSFPLILNSSDKSGDGWTWVAESKTLTLDGIDWNPSNTVNLLVTLPDGAQVILVDGSDNYIQNNSLGYGMFCEGDLSISGGGNLTVVSGGAGIYAKGQLSISMLGTLEVTADQNVAILSDNGVNLIDCSNIIINCGNFCILSSAPVNVIESTVQLSGTSGIMVFCTESPNGTERIGGGDVYIERSTVIVEVIWTNDFSMAFFASNSTNDAKIVLEGCAIISPDEPIIEAISLYGGVSQPGSVLIQPVFELLFDGNEGVVKQEDTQYIYPENELVSISSLDCVRTGYRLVSWNTSKDGTGTKYALNDTFTITEDITLYAQWTELYTVTFFDWDETVLVTQVVLSGGSATSPTVELRDKYRFIGWDKPYSNVTTNLAVTAQYEKLPEPKTESFVLSKNIILVSAFAVLTAVAILGTIVFVSKSRKKKQ